MTNKNALLLIIGIVISSILLFGCQQTQSTSSSLFTDDETAVLCGSLVSLSLKSDDNIKTTAQISSASVDSAESKTEGITGPNLGADDWWNVLYAYSNYNWDLYFKVKNIAGDWITNSADLDALLTTEMETLKIYALLTMTVGGDTMTLSMGASKDDPMIFDGLASTTTARTVNGPISLAGSSSGTNYSISMTYNDLALDASGYPMFGTISFSFTEGDSATYAGTITFDGGNTAVLAFTSGSDSSYLVNIDTGAVSSM